MGGNLPLSHSIKMAVQFGQKLLRTSLVRSDFPFFSRSPVPCTLVSINKEDKLILLVKMCLVFYSLGNTRLLQGLKSPLWTLTLVGGALLLVLCATSFHNNLGNTSWACEVTRSNAEITHCYQQRGVCPYNVSCKLNLKRPEAEIVIYLMLTVHCKNISLLQLQLLYLLDIVVSKSCTDACKYWKVFLKIGDSYV